MKRHDMSRTTTIVAFTLAFVMVLDAGAALARGGGSAGGTGSSGAASGAAGAGTAGTGGGEAGPAPGGPSGLGGSTVGGIGPRGDLYLSPVGALPGTPESTPAASPVTAPGVVTPGVVTPPVVPTGPLMCPGVNVSDPRKC